ncbi:hypothetical protein JCM8208_000135 [Rhodotorula glutinis]
MAAPLERVYRPRALTRREQELDHEHARLAQERTVKRAKKEAAQHEDRSSDYHHSGISGIGYKDFQLGRGISTKSRALLDEQAYAARRRTVETRLLDNVPRLSSVCLDVLVDNYGERGVFDALDPAVHREYAAPLLATLARRIGHGVLPFQVWLDFAHRFALDLPPQRRTYRGLCVGDVKELGLVKELNAEAVERWAHETAYPSPGREPLVPPFYLAYLDLRGDTTFTDGDIYKLRNPLSHFLTVLRLDGTSVSDEALTWIARAAREAPQYAQLQVLSLRGLLKVTDAGVLKLSSLANLRSLDLRGTQCTSAIRAALNRSFLGAPPSSTSSSAPPAPRFWRPARPRPDLPSALPSTLEPQLFEPSNFSPARTLAILHYLARVESTPAGPQRRDILRARALVKPLGLHLTAVTRASSSSTTAPSSTSSRPDATADELYRDQLALSYGAKRAAHHAGLGTITSTVPLSRGLVEEEGRRESDKGAAFRNRNDSVAAGEWIGAGARTGGRAMLPGQTAASLYDVGTRKLSRDDKERGAREPFSDSDGDDEREKELEAEEVAERKRWEDESAQRSRFYRPLEPPTPRGPRAWTEPLPSDLMLLRHVPYVAPWEGSRALPVAVAAPSEAHELPPASAGGTLVKKRKRPSFPLDSPSPPSRTPARAPPPPSSSSSPAVPTSSTGLVKKRQPSSATSSSSSTTTSRTPAPALYTARSASKNIVRTAPVLPKRSALSAFRTKKKT